MPNEDTEMDWNTLYCPNKGCRYYGIRFEAGKMVKNGSSCGQPQALCRGCGGNVALSYATAYYGLESEPSIFETAVRALAEGNSPGDSVKDFVYSSTVVTGLAAGPSPSKKEPWPPTS
jgi:hypothetical protein